MTSIDHHFAAHNSVRSEAIGNRKSDPLPRLLAQLVDRAGTAIVLRAVSRPWCSALFQGRRHGIALRMQGEDMARRQADFANGLAEIEWTLPGHFVADITLDDVAPEGGGTVLTVSALTIEEW